MDNMRRMQREQPETDPRAGTKTMIGISTVIVAVVALAIIGAVVWIWLL